MSDREPRNSDAQMDAYLDGLLSGPELETYKSSLQGDSKWQEQVELQARIDDRVRQLFATEGPSAEHLVALAERFHTTRPLAFARRRIVVRWAVGTAAAAAIGAMLLAWRPWNAGHSEPFFRPQPLAQVYAAAVESGFAPYYECRDADRFAEVFSRRQSQPLRLLPLPDGVQMLGISYPGGLSRDSTAMLCRVDGRPVMVLVDRAQADRPEAASNGDPALRVFRAERDGLVFYEITPFEFPRVTKFLAAAPDA